MSDKDDYNLASIKHKKTTKNLKVNKFMSSFCAKLKMEFTESTNLDCVCPFTSIGFKVTVL